MCSKIFVLKRYKNASLSCPEVKSREVSIFIHNLEPVDINDNKQVEIKYRAGNFIVYKHNLSSRKMT